MNSKEISKVEESFGFVFGNDGSADSANAAPHSTVVCNNPVCAHYNQHVQVHQDAEQPVHCGGCFTVLMCDHLPGNPQVTTTGTFGAPVQLTRTSCTKCGLTLTDVEVALPPMKLKDLPVSLLSSLPDA